MKSKMAAGMEEAPELFDGKGKSGKKRGGKRKGKRGGRRKGGRY
jgi:hypothetical protein